MPRFLPRGAGPDPFDAIVVGGGHNGLVAAFYLARGGLRVIVLERRDFVGGACATEELFDGFRVSSCSYVCWMLQEKVIEDLDLPRHGFAYKRLDPVHFNPYPDGSYIEWWNDGERARGEVARINQRDAAALPAWEDFWFRASGLMVPFLLQDPPTMDELRAHAKESGEEELLDRLLTASIADICQEYFEDSRVQATLAQVEDIGDPWTPGSAWTETYFHCNSHTDFGYAVVVGGMGTITKAMASAAQERGVEIRTNAEVERILVDGNRAVGVRLASGEELGARIVLSNADPKRTYLTLLGPGDLSTEVRARIESLSTRASYLKFHCVMDRLPDITDYLGREAQPNEAGYIRIAPSLEHYRRAWHQVSRGEPASGPIVHIQIPTVYDPSMASREGHVVSIWALFAPPKLAHGTWEERREEVGNALIDYVTEFIPNFRTDMREWMLFTPQDLENRVGLTDGNIRHLDMIPGQMLYERPFKGAAYETSIEGLYLCGAGTHPGGEVTGAPGHNAAQAVLRERGRSSGRSS